MPISIIAAVIVGALLGTFNGFIVAKINIAAFIVTLGTLYIAEGLVNVISLGKPIYLYQIVLVLFLVKLIYLVSLYQYL